MLKVRLTKHIAYELQDKNKYLKFCSSYNPVQNGSRNIAKVVH